MLHLPLLDSCDHLVVGGGVRAMMCALRLSGQGDVLLMTEDTCLYAEISRSGDDRVPRGLPEKWRELLFPDSVLERDGRVHPDRLKRYGERLMAERGVRLLYACQTLGRAEDCVLAAHKSGLYAIRCGRAWDARVGNAAPEEPCFCLHTMRDGEHHVTYVPAAREDGTPQGVFARYEAALAQLPKGHTLARSAMGLTDRAGLMADCSDARPLADAAAGSFVPRQRNPLFESLPSVALPHGLAAETARYDVVVIGGGTAGASAAIFSARQGLKTLLLEMNDQLGGTGTVGGVSTYWFGRRDGATRQIDEAVDAYYRRLHLPRRACLWCEDDVFAPTLKAHALLGMCLEAGVEVRFGSVVCGVEQDGSRVTGVYEAHAGELRLNRAAMLLDCTGDGDVCMMAGAAHTYGSERDGMTYWGSLAQYTSPDQYRNNFSTMVHVGDPKDYTRFILAGRLRGEGLYDHGQYVAVRESRHIEGMEKLTLPDIMAMRPVKDPLYVCFSNYDPKGRLTADLAYFGLLCPNQQIPVPRGAVIPVDGQRNPIEGLLVGGKAISCAHDAFPGVRMQPDLQRQGLALAALAGCAIRQRTTAWRANGVTEAIQALGGDLCLPEVGPPRPLSEVISELRGDEPWEWLDTPPTACTARVEPIVQIMTAPGEEALPLLRRAWKGAKTEALRLTLARLLLWHGDETGAETVIAKVHEMLDQCDGLPRRAASVNYGQLLPDHGLMPEAVYLLNSLSRSRHADILPVLTRMTERLEGTARDWKDLRAGIYCYCECPAYIAARRGDAALAPLLRRILALPELNAPAEDELMRERFDMLRITLLHALHLLGDEAGRDGLTAYTHDERRPLALAASMLLKEEEP